MTLYELERHKLLKLPVEGSWQKEWRNKTRVIYKGSTTNLTLRYVRNWGNAGEDDAFYLRCTDDKDNWYSSEITSMDQHLDKFFILLCLIDDYSKTLGEIFATQLPVNNRPERAFKAHS